MNILIRKHLIPDYVSKKVIFDQYQKEIRETKILTASWDMDFWIRKTFSFRDSIVREKIIFIQFYNEKSFIDSIKHDSMVEEWHRSKKSDAKNLMLEKTVLKTKCSICLCSKGNFMRIKPCNCLFHKHCIIEASKYSMLCPLCQTPIKEKKNIVNAKKKEKSYN